MLFELDRKVGAKDVNVVIVDIDMLDVLAGKVQSKRTSRWQMSQ